MTEENRASRKASGRMNRGEADGMPRTRGATATYDTKMRRLTLVVAGMVLEPNVPIPPHLIAQARASFLALVNAEFGDDLNVPRETTPEGDDTWPDEIDF